MKKSYKLIEDPEAIAKALLSEEERRSLRRLAEAIADKMLYVPERDEGSDEDWERLQRIATNKEKKPKCKRCDAVFNWWATPSEYCKICKAEMKHGEVSDQRD